MKDGAEVDELTIDCKGEPDNFVDIGGGALSSISCDIKRKHRDSYQLSLIILLVLELLLHFIPL